MSRLVNKLIIWLGFTFCHRPIFDLNIGFLLQRRTFTIRANFHALRLIFSRLFSVLFFVLISFCNQRKIINFQFSHNRNQQPKLHVFHRKAQNFLNVRIPNLHPVAQQQIKLNHRTEQQTLKRLQPRSQRLNVVKLRGNNC